jgi:DNA invertase Pin-like site-specific DNA recombinase
MPRAALYARYSSDLQSAASIADQFRVLRERAARDGFEIVAEHSDAAISGASMIGRPGLQCLLMEARAGAYDIVLIEALDRLSRDQEDTAGLFKRLRHAGVRILSLAEGEIDELHIGLKGTMNALFLRDLAAKVRRGQRGRVEAGRIPGGITYGYRRVRELDAAGEIEGGRRTVDAEQAAVVRRIFSDYIAGVSPRAIAAALNREGVPSPRGGLWNASTINGHRGRRNGILNNELYIGRIVYNRQSFQKDPDTGKRQARPNARAAWITTDVPALAIVDDDTWRRAQAAKAAHAPQPHRDGRRPKRLLSGLLRCGACGGPYIVISRTRVACSAHRERGTCSNARTVPMAAIERRVLDGLKERLLAPDLVADFMREFQAEAARRRATADDDRRRAGRERGELERKIARLVAAIGDGIDTPAMRQQLLEAERRKAELARQAAEAAAPPITLHPNLPALYRRKVAELETVLAAAAPAARAQAITILRSMIEAVIVRPTAARGGFELELHGRLAAILAALAETKTAGREKRPAEVWSAVVAGGGFIQSPQFPPLAVFV